VNIYINFVVKKMVRTYKCSLKTIVKDDKTIDKINNAVYKCNEIVTLTYQFIKLYILDKYRKKQHIPNINKDLIRQASNIISCKDSQRGRKSENSKIIADMKDFYKINFSKLVNNYQPSRTNISNALKFVYNDMEQNYINNIQMHFVQRLKKVITEGLLFAFKKDNEKLFESNKEQYDVEYNKLLKEIRIIKAKILGLDEYIENNICNNNILKKYKKIIKMFKIKFLPNIEKSVYYDLKIDPFKFLPKMILINDKFERMELKLNNMLPLRHSFVPKNIQLDTNCIIEILLENGEGKAKAYANVNKNEKYIWNKFFNKKLNKSYKKSSYVFANSIKTDGFSVSVLEATQNDVQNKKNKFVKGYKKCKEEPKKDIKYITEIKEVELRNIQDKNYKLIGVDPGKRNLIQMIDDDENIVSYTASQRRHETRISLNEKKRKEDLNNSPNIKQKVENFTINGKTTNYEKFEKYIIDRNKLSNIVKSYYEKDFFRQLNWHRFINVQKSEKTLIKKIKDTYGDNIIIGIGDWSESQQMKYSKPTKGIGMTRLLSMYFETYYINEDYTSKICNDCGSETKYYTKVLKQDTFMNSTKKRKSKRIKKKNIKHIHGLLCCSNNKKCSKLWNRDTNGAKNILEILRTYIEDSTRPIALTSPTGRAVMLKFARMKVKTVPSLLQSQKIESYKCISKELKLLDVNILNKIQEETIKFKKIRLKENKSLKIKLSIIKSLKSKSLKKFNIMSQINL
jgi:hypothetical protein